MKKKKKKWFGNKIGKWEMSSKGIKAIQEKIKDEVILKALKRNYQEHIEKWKSIDKPVRLPWRVLLRIFNSFRSMCRQFCMCGKDSFLNNSPWTENLFLGMCMILITTDITFSKPFKKEATSSWKSLYKLFYFLKRYGEPQRLVE